MVSRLVRAGFGARLAAMLVAVAAAMPLAAVAQTVTRPFQALRPASGPAATAHALVVELSPREVLSGVHLDVAPATAPAAGTQYAVWVNGRLAARTDASASPQRIALAPAAFSPGVNSIQLARVAPNTPDASLNGQTAQNAAAPVDDARSSVSLDFAGLRPNPTPTLAQIPLAFDARALLPRTVTLDFGRRALPSPERLRAAALAVQGIAARMPHADVRVAWHGVDTRLAWYGSRDPASWAIDPDAAAAGDVLVIGTREALADTLPASVVASIGGPSGAPFIGLYPANGGKSVIVVLSGTSDADCLRAARAFADPAVVFPARNGNANGAGNAITLDNTIAVREPPTHRAISLTGDAPLVRAAMNFAAIAARHTGVPVDFTFAFPGRIASADLLFSQDSAVSGRVRSALPVYPPLRPHEAVSVAADLGPHRLVAIIGNDEPSVELSVDLLRGPAAWSLFNRGPVLFDTAEASAIPLEAAKRSRVAALRLLLADPAVFWPVLLALLALCGLFVNLALKAQVVRRLGEAGPSTHPDTPLKQKT
jgi:hypothetical protein